MQFTAEEEEKVRKAKQAGIPDDYIIRRITSERSAKPKPTEEPKKGNILTNSLPLLGGIAGGAIGSIFAPGAGTVGGGAAGSALGEALRQRITGEETNAKKIATEGAIGLAGAGVGKVLGAGARAIGIGARAAENVGAKTVAGKVGGKISQSVGGGLKNVGSRAANTIIEPSTGVAKKALENGVDISATYMKHLPRLGTDVNKMVGTKAGKGVIDDIITEAEDRISNVGKRLPNYKISGKSVVDSLKEQRRNLDDVLGGGQKREALDAIIGEAEKKYANGIPIQKARDILRSANQEFGKSIIDDTTGAVASSAQKLEANALRQALKGEFPEIADALDDQQSLIILREALKRTAARGSTGQLSANANPFDLMKSVPNAAIRNPKVAGAITKTSTVGNRIQGGSTPLAGVMAQVGGQYTANNLRTGGQEDTGIPLEPELDLEQSAGMQLPNMPATAGNSQGANSPFQDPAFIQSLVLSDVQSTGGKNLGMIQNLQEMFAAPEQKPLSATQQAAVNKATTGLEAIDRIEEGASTGNLVGRKINPLNQEGRQLDSDINSLIDIIGFLRTGAAYTKEQRKAYVGLMPSVLDSQETRQKKVRALRRELERYTNPSPEPTQSLPSDPSQVTF